MPTQPDPETPAEAATDPAEGTADVRPDATDPAEGTAEIRADAADPADPADIADPAEAMKAKYRDALAHKHGAGGAHKTVHGDKGEAAHSQSTGPTQKMFRRKAGG
jgi:hypothetical protein